MLKPATQEFAGGGSTPPPGHVFAPVEAPAVREIRAGVGAAVADFEDVRSRLFRIAHRTLGRAADAEDVVQDVWIRWQGVDRAAVRDRVAFLSIVTTRVALNAVTSARVRREVCLGVNLPERDDAA